MNRYRIKVSLTCEHNLIAEVDATSREEAISEVQEMADGDQSGIELDQNAGWSDCEWISDDREVLEYEVNNIGAVAEIRRRRINEKIRELQNQLEVTTSDESA